MKTDNEPTSARVDRLVGLRCGDLAEIFRLLDAVGTTANFFDGIRSELEAKKDETLIVVRAKMERQLTEIEKTLRTIIELSVCPVWGAVSDIVRAKCRVCGFGGVSDGCAGCGRPLSPINGG